MKLAFATLLLSASLQATTYNVTSAPYNAVGDGVADDTAAIQDALDDCASSADTVFIPAGTYSVNTLNLDNLGCNVDGVRGLSILKARVNGQAAVLQAPGNSQDSIITDLVFDMNNLAHTGLKLENAPDGVIVRYNAFINGGSLGSIFIPNGTAAGSPNSSFDHNVFMNVHIGIFSYGFWNNANADNNYFHTFHQGISGGGCNPSGSGSNVTVDNNVFIQGRRMAIEFCGRQNTISASNNYISDWRPSPDPSQEQYSTGGFCFASNPYMCDSMGISLATGGTTTVANNNRIYRQAGTSWGLEFTAQGAASEMRNNVVKEASVSYVDEACAELGIPGNCATVRVNVTGNIGCGGTFTSTNPSHFANWDATNNYYTACSNPSVPANDALPAMPFQYPPAAGPPPPRTQLTLFLIM